MKFKQIAAAAALIAASAPSFAVLTLGNASDSPELIAFVFDRAAQVSYALDLGVAITDFNGASNYTYNLNSENFTAFLGLAGGAGGLEFSVYAGENFGPTQPGSRNLFTTVGTSTTPMTNTLINTAVNNTNAGFLGNVVNNSVGTTFSSANNGDGYAAAGSTAYFLNSNSEQFNIATLGWDTSNVEGTSALFRKFSQSGTTSQGALAATQTTFDGVWTLTQNAGGQAYTLQYSAVPDADGLALMLAGLGAMGFIARRRAAK